MSIYKNLKEIRLYLGLSQNQFAKKLGVNVSNVSRWENKNNGMSLDMAYLISNKLNIPIEKLVSEDYDIRTDDFKANEILQKIRQLSEKDKTIVNNIIDSFKK